MKSQTPILKTHANRTQFDNPSDVIIPPDIIFCQILEHLHGHLQYILIRFIWLNYCLPVGRTRRVTKTRVNGLLSHSFSKDRYALNFNYQFQTVYFLLPCQLMHATRTHLCRWTSPLIKRNGFGKLLHDILKEGKGKMAFLTFLQFEM